MRFRRLRFLQRLRKALVSGLESRLKRRQTVLRAWARDGVTCPLVTILLLAFSLSAAPNSGGFLTGSVREQSGAGIPNVEMQVENEATGARQKLVSDENGRFTTPELIPGEYRLTLRRRGFRTASYSGLRVRAGETRAGDFVMELTPMQQEITVQSSRDTTDPAGSGLAVTRDSSEKEIPANGRDLHAFYAFVPGATTTPASSGDGGQFSVNGQRPNTNTVRVDGINANTGLGISALPGTYPGSSLPAMTAIGSTQGAAAQDEMERVELRSSDFSPETGERPGAEIRIETRSGSNDFHGSAFGLFRPRALDSEDLFAQKYNVPLASSSLNGYGATLGGAIVRDRTFFFVAAEREQVRDTALQLMATPSSGAREQAGGGVGLLLNAFPMPIGPDLGSGTAIGGAALDERASVDTFSARADQIIGSTGRIFVRFSDAPSRSVTQQLGEIDASLRSSSVTLGVTGASLGAVHDLRFNYTKAVAASSWAAGSASEQAAFNAFPNQLADGNFAIVGPGTQLIEGPASGANAALAIAGVGQLVDGAGSRTTQEQAEGVYTFSRERGRHDLRIGADYILLIPSTLLGGTSVVAAVSTGVEQLLHGDPLGLTYSDGKPIIYRENISIGSAFAQDTFRISDRLSVLYGVRWDLAFPASTAASSAYLSEVGVWGGPGTPVTASSAVPAALNLRRWPMNYKDLAPRLGLAFRLPALGLVFRAGGGIFHETALGSLVNPVNLSPLNSWQFVPGNGRTATTAASFYSGAVPPPLTLPTVWQWRASLEHSIGGHSTASLAYAGAAGTRLLRLEGTVDPVSGILQQSFFSSDGWSRYAALEAQLRGNLTSSLSSLISYTWGHSIDNGSQVSAVYLKEPGDSAPLDRGSSDFDVRQNFNAALNYRVPAVFNGRGQSWCRNWALSSSLAARSGFPFDVTTEDRSIGLGFANTGRPDLAAGQPLWIRGSGLLNPNAFQAPAPGAANGTLGRNVLNGPGLFQVDASLRRQFRLFEGASLEASVSAFNLFNRASFSNPEGYLGSPLFGQPLSMQSLMMGSGSPTNGLAPIFQAGGPRTVEIGFKISF
jgi:hypothetical protein